MGNPKPPDSQEFNWIRATHQAKLIAWIPASGALRPRGASIQALKSSQDSSLS